MAPIERLWRSMNGQYARGLFLYRPPSTIEADLDRYAEWLDAERPDQGLGDLTPDEIHEGRSRRRPPTIPRKATLHVRHLDNDRALPILRLRRAA